jgi:hypothetical protein
VMLFAPRSAADAGGRTDATARPRPIDALM